MLLFNGLGLFEVRNQLIDLPLDATLAAQGATAGYTITHIALRVLRFPFSPRTEFLLKSLSAFTLGIVYPIYLRNKFMYLVKPVNRYIAADLFVLGLKVSLTIHALALFTFSEPKAFNYLVGIPIIGALTLLSSFLYQRLGFHWLFFLISGLENKEIPKSNDQLTPLIDEFLRSISSVDEKAIFKWLRERLLSILASNQMIERLSLALENPQPNALLDNPSSHQLLTLLSSKDILNHMSQWLTSKDLIQLSRTSRGLYNSVCGPMGKDLWIKKEGVSVVARRNLSNLSKIFRDIDSRFPLLQHPLTLRLNAALLREFFILAWPLSQMSLLKGFYPDENDGIENFPDQYRKITDQLRYPPENFTIESEFSSWDLDSPDKELLFRYVRDVDNFLSYYKLKPSLSLIFWEMISYYGLPRRALEPFCQQLSQKPEQLLDDDRLFPIVIKILQRINIDHPDFDFEGKIPAEFISKLTNEKIENAERVNLIEGNINYIKVEFIHYSRILGWTNY